MAPSVESVFQLSVSDPGQVFSQLKNTTAAATPLLAANLDSEKSSTHLQTDAEFSEDLPPQIVMLQEPA